MKKAILVKWSAFDCGSEEWCDYGLSMCISKDEARSCIKFAESCASDIYYETGTIEGEIEISDKMHEYLSKYLEYRCESAESIEQLINEYKHAMRIFK